jgi:hypothetical protein
MQTFKLQRLTLLWGKLIWYVSQFNAQGKPGLVYTTNKRSPKRKHFAFQQGHVVSTAKKVKLSLCLINYALRHGDTGEGKCSSTILDLSTRWKWMVSFTHRPLYSRVRSPRFQLDMRLDSSKNICEFNINGGLNKRQFISLLKWWRSWTCWCTITFYDWC